jgi:hypothetical protein
MARASALRISGSAPAQTVRKSSNTSLRAPEAQSIGISGIEQRLSSFFDTEVRAVIHGGQYQPPKCKVVLLPPIGDIRTTLLSVSGVDVRPPVPDEVEQQRPSPVRKILSVRHYRWPMKSAGIESFVRLISHRIQVQCSAKQRGQFLQHSGPDRGCVGSPIDGLDHEAGVLAVSEIDLGSSQIG